MMGFLEEYGGEVLECMSLWEGCDGCWRNPMESARANEIVKVNDESVGNGGSQSS